MLHRVLLTRESLDIHFAAIRVVSQIIKAAQESLDSKKTANTEYVTCHFTISIIKDDQINRCSYMNSCNTYRISSWKCYSCYIAVFPLNLHLATVKRQRFRLKEVPCVPTEPLRNLRRLLDCSS